MRKSVPAVRSAHLLIVMVLAGCNQPADPPPETAEPPTPIVEPGAPPAVGEPAKVSSLAGAWRVAGLDGRSFDESYGLSVTGDANEVWTEPKCAGFVRSYRIQGDGVAFEPPEPGPPAGSSPPPVCAIAAPSRLGEVFRALDEADTVARTASNGILISGPDHSVTLFSQ